MIGGPKVKNFNIFSTFVFSFGPIWAHKKESVQQSIDKDFSIPETLECFR